jgi:hypothetical protein
MAQAQFEDVNPLDDIFVESAVTFDFPKRLAYFLGGNTSLTAIARPRRTESLLKPVGS